jgi:hypothetical protein
MIMLEGGLELLRIDNPDIIRIYLLPINTCFGAIMVEAKSGLALRMTEEPIDGVGTQDQFCDLSVFRVLKTAGVY